MAKVSKNVVDKNLRDIIFEELISPYTGSFDIQRINDRQYGTIMCDLNGNHRYVRIGVIVAEEREDMTPEELMQKEIDEYNAKQEAKAEKTKAKEAKIAKDKAKREEEKKNVVQ